MDYYYANGDEQRGPVDDAELKSLQLAPDTLVWREGLADWGRLDALPEFAELMPSVPKVETVPPLVIDPPAIPSEPFAPAVVIPAEVHRPAVISPGMGTVGYQTPPAVAPTNGMAVASLVLGIVSFPTMCLYLVGVITAILAIVFGLIARGKIRRQEVQGGAGLALAGIICGSCALGVVVLLILTFVMIGIFGH